MIGWLTGNELYILLSIGILFNILWLSEFKLKLNMNTVAIVLISVLHTAIGVLIVKCFAVLEAGESGGMSLYGAVFFMPVVYYLGAKFSKRRIADVFDIFTICMLFTLMCARVNCLISGCCIGLPIPGTTGLFWPTRQLEIIFYIIMLVKMGSKVGKQLCNGIVYPIYMMAYGAFRFITEWFRESDSLIGFFHISHIWSIVAFIIGAFIYNKIKKNEEGIKARKKEEKKK